MAFEYQEASPVAPGAAAFRLLSTTGVAAVEAGSRRVLEVAPAALTALASAAMRDVNFLLRPSHQVLVGRILRDPEASENDRFVARTLLRNAVIAADRRLPLCQDTGTAIVLGWKGERVWTGADDAAALAEGIFQAYAEENFRYSQVAPLSTYEERNTGTNLPAQIDIEAVRGDGYEFLFLAKGGGSANKSQLFQMTKALLRPDALLAFLVEKLRAIGTAACPPYHLAVVVGGTSAEATMRAVKLASAGMCDSLPGSGCRLGRPFRDRELEALLLAASRRVGLGAQFGGKYFCHEVRVVRLPRHGASCPVGIGVSCSADRNVRARIDANGVWLENLELDPARLLPDAAAGAPGVAIDLNRPMTEIRTQLSACPVRTRLRLSGTLIVARDMAHARIRDMLARGEPMPDYFKAHPVYYAGPAKTPSGMATGSFGPTTAQRMDPYVDEFQALGGSLVMLAKGNRSAAVVAACRRHGGFYLGSIGGPAALLAKDHIRRQRVLDFPEFGMEAVWEIDVVDFPAFVLIDDKGNDFFRQLAGAAGG